MDYGANKGTPDECLKSPAPLLPSRVKSAPRLIVRYKRILVEAMIHRGPVSSIGCGGRQALEEEDDEEKGAEGWVVGDFIIRRCLNPCCR